MALGAPQLDGMIRQALAQNPNLAAAEARVKAASFETDAVRGGQAPQVNGVAGAQRERINTQSFGFTGFPSPTINLYQLGASASYDFDVFGKKRRSTEASLARAEAERRRADAAYLMLTTNAGLQAVRIATLKAQIASVKETTDGDQRVIGMIKRAQAAGGAPASATSIGEAQLAQDLALLPNFERQLSEARHQLALLVGRSPAEWAPPEFSLADFTAPTAIPVAMPSALVRKRPDILEAEANLHAVTADIGVAVADLYPDLSIAANFTQGTIEPSDLFKYASSGWSFGANLAQPIFHGGTLKAKEAKARALADASLNVYRETVLKAFVQVSDALTNLAADDRSIAALQRAADAARANFNDASRAYELGAGPLLNIFDAGRQLNLAQREKIEAQGRKLSDVIELFAATAADWR
jgi:NodT family efflux transporter outer membrane factor (OMF) lipoprotein